MKLALTHLALIATMAAAAPSTPHNHKRSNCLQDLIDSDGNVTIINGGMGGVGGDGGDGSGDGNGGNGGNAGGVGNTNIDITVMSTDEKKGLLSDLLNGVI